MAEGGWGGGGEGEGVVWGRGGLGRVGVGGGCEEEPEVVEAGQDEDADEDAHGDQQPLAFEGEADLAGGGGGLRSAFALRRSAGHPWIMTGQAKTSIR